MYECIVDQVASDDGTKSSDKNPKEPSKKDRRKPKTYLCFRNPLSLDYEYPDCTAEKSKKS